MARKVLLIEDDNEMLRILRKDLKRYAKAFSPLIVENTSVAVKMIKKYRISLVVMDPEKLDKDGIAFLSYLNENYPDIHSMAIITQNTDGSKAYKTTTSLKKPFIIDDMAKKIIEIFKSEASGGILRGASPGTFLQLVEMEQKSCTIRISDDKTNQQGVLFFQEGELLDARLDQLNGREAAYRILSWDEATMSIQESCIIQENKVQADLQALLLEAMRLKDEDEKEADVKMSQDEIDVLMESQRDQEDSQELLIEVDDSEIVFEEEEETSDPVTPVPVKTPSSEIRPKIEPKISSAEEATMVYSVADNVVGSLSNLKEMVLGSAFFRYGIRLIGFVVVVVFIGFAYLFFTMESDKDLNNRIDQAKSFIRSRQEIILQLDKDIEALYTSKENSIKRNESSVVIMEVDLKILELEEKQEKSIREANVRQEALEEWQSRLEAIKRKTLIERMKERIKETISG